MLRSIQLRSLVAKQTLATTRNRVAIPRVSNSIATTTQRFYSEKNEPKKEESKEKDNVKKTESLLTDDILEQAGMDMNKENSTEEDSTSDEQKKRWAGTAKKSTDQSTTDLRRERFSKIGYVGMLGAVLGAAAYFSREWDNEEEQKQHPGIPNGYTPDAIFNRLKARTGGVFNTFSEPVFENLLPDPLPEPYGRPMTLVIGLEDILIHSEWTREHGWRTAKRPGVDYFLGYLAQFYEIVVFSNNYQFSAEKVIAKLDPYRASISHPLFREGSRYKDGKIVKDLAHLNRDLSKVIMIDCNSDAWSLQPDNAIPMKQWQGTPGDKDLVKLIPLLEWIAASNVKDVRPILKSYQGTESVPDEFAKREAIARKKFEEDFYKEYQRSGGSWAMRVLGLAPAEPPKPKMPQDLMREQAQKGYEEFKKYIEEHGEKMLAEEKAREQEIMNEHKMTLGKMLTEGQPKPEEIMATQERIEKERAESAAEASKAAAEGGHHK